MIQRGDQVGVRCVFMRGGTSRGAILRGEDLPTDAALRERLILAIYGSPDRRQIDGIGGADPLTSKVGIVSRSSRPDADVDFVFGQVRVDEARVDFQGNCGNLSAAIGPFVIDEGLVPAHEPVTIVRIHLVNTGASLTSAVAVRDGRAAVEGDVEMDGVPGTGAAVVLDFGDSSDTLRRGLLPTGAPREHLAVSWGTVEASIVDAANPIVFVGPEPFGLSGTELPDDLVPGVLERLQAVREAAAVRLGLSGSLAIPKVYVVSRPADYVDTRGRQIRAATVDLVGRGLSMGVPHRAYAGTAAICTGVAARIAGTIVNEVARPRAGDAFCIGHPSGCIRVEVAVETRGPAPVVRRAALVRTARRIMEGVVFAPAGRVCCPA
jgi:2-methylaconitate cis-trans-isomerase PrpF